MISAKEALDSPRVRLSEKELSIFQMADARITAAIRDSFAGEPFNIPLPLDDVPSRVVFALKRRFEKPAEDGSRWNIGLVSVLNESKEIAGYRMTFEPAPPADFLAVKGGTAGGAALVPAASSKPQGILRALFEELASVNGLPLDAPRAVPSLAPTLSIILGTYQRIEHVKAAVASFRKSVGDLSYEIVICDGGSTDGSREWLAAQRDVVLIGERHLEGAVKAFNQCFRASRGEYIANVNDDCVVEGVALIEGVKYLREHPEAGQVAFAFKGEDDNDWIVNDIYPRKTYPSVTWPTTYANFGITRRAIAEQVASICGGFWAPVYSTYAGDCELSAWIHKLGHKVVKLPHLRVVDTRIADPLREKNNKQSGVEAKRMYARWPAEAFKPDGPDPRVTPEELERFRRVRAGGKADDAAPPPAAPPADDKAEWAQMIGWPEPGEERRLQRLAPRIRALDPVDGRFPARAEHLTRERVLHVSLCTDADPQAGLVRALRALGSDGYREARWYADYPDYEKRQAAILDAAREIKPSLIFMQLQAPNAVGVETVRELRRVADPSCVIATWNGDIAMENSPWAIEWMTGIGRVADVNLHSSMSHVHAMRAAGIHNSARLDIALDIEQYRPPERVHGNQGEPDTAPLVAHETHTLGGVDYDVVFLGSRYGNDAFSSSMRFHDAALRDAVVLEMKRAFGNRFGLFGRGWADYLRANGVEHVDQTVPLAQAHEVYWRSRIGLNVSLANYLDCYQSDRMHRILGCGTLLLTKSFPGMGTYGLRRDETCLIWETPEEAVNLARIAAHNLAGNAGDGIRERTEDIAAAGAHLAREHHTWSVRMQEMVPYINAVRSARNG